MNIVSVSFGDENLEVTFTEDHEKSAEVMMVRLALIRNTVAPEALQEVLELLKQIVDEGYVKLRNPQP